jgi:hypothetical protein
MSPIQLLDSEEDTEDWIRSRKKFWAADPVHMTPDGYTELTRVLIAAATTANYDRTKDDDGAAAVPAAQAAKQPRPPPRVFKRQGWVSADDTTAHRVYAKPQHTGGGHGRWSQPPRGFFRGRKFSRGRGGGGNPRQPPRPRRPPEPPLLTILVCFLFCR